jgi:predicted RNase H-like HicB family nuclease
MTNRPFYIRAEWDEEASVWVATSDDVPGLATEADSMDALVKKLRSLIPELMELNGLGEQIPRASFEIISRRFEELKPVSA